MEEKIIYFQIGITTNEMKYVLNYFFFYVLQVENGAAEMGEIVCRLCNERFSSKKERKTHTVKSISHCIMPLTVREIPIIWERVPDELVNVLNCCLLILLVFNCH